MGKLSTYDIAYKGLKEGLHEFNYTIDAKFFELFEGSLVEKANINAIVTFEKMSALLVLSVKIEGTVELTCDRCLDNYNQFVKQEAKLIVKFGEEKADEGGDFFFVSPGEYHFNIAQLLYEYIVLSIPSRHVHPGKKGGDECNKDMLNKLKVYMAVERQENTDERWEALKKLKNNN
ncbi:hypothetical protein MNBD_BACTEROID01-1306 [hydrothermal vent metagenome]|uniref:DUF177 domain-containing protein n=1 Tax=hydrothermal vent metagenome TaxID=652676 RepID=A0A3B0TFB3_9ZZZZ